jgi:NADH-ubiquinone oxidoreductase chain 4
VGIDGISLFFVILTTFLIPICILVGGFGMRSYGKEYITTFVYIYKNSLTPFIVVCLFFVFPPTIKLM